MSKLWVAKCAVPGLNVPLYFLSDKQPTRKQVQAAWAKGGSDTVLKWPDECADLPLRDCYPGCVGVSELEVTTL